MDADPFPVPGPEPPDSPDAWYAPSVHDQYEIVPGVVATVADGDDGFRYDVREPTLSAGAEADLRAVREHFDGVDPVRPRTREGAAERFRAGFDRKYDRIIDRIVSCSPAGRRRLEYHALAELRCLGELTPHALDDAIQVADATGSGLSVHLTDYAPAATGIEGSEFVEQFCAERLERYAVGFAGYSVPVVRYRERLLGADPFERKYAVLEPDRLPGDERLLAACKERIRRDGVDGIDGRSGFEDRASLVRERAETLLSRQFAARGVGAWFDAAGHRLRAALADRGLVAEPVDRRFSADRVDDLVYYVLRDLVGHGQLTVPIRDPNLEDIEANRVGERIKVIPRGGEGREPTNLAFGSEPAFVNVVTRLAAADGVELSATRPSARVSPDLDGVDRTIRCTVALPSISEDGPHVSIRKQAFDDLSPVDLVESGSLPTELVALLWLLYEHHGTVLFSGPAGAGTTTLLNAHTPFIGYDARPVSIDEGAMEVCLPHETGVSLTTRERHRTFENAPMSELVAETNHLNPDVGVIDGVDSSESFATLGAALRAGNGVLATARAGSVEALVARAADAGLSPRLLSEIDLVVFATQADGDRYVDSAVELFPEPAAERLDRPTDAVFEGETPIHYDRIVERTPGGAWEFAYNHPKLGDPTERRALETFARLAERTDRSPDAVESEFHRKHRYVEYLVRTGVSDLDALFGFVSDLRADEAATVERIRQEHSAPDA